MSDEEARAPFLAVATEVYEPLQRYLRRRCAADAIDEVLNDVLLVIWRRVDDIPAESVLPWCYGIARRCLANHRRAGTRRLRLVQRAASTHVPAIDHGWTEQSEVQLHEALATLPELDREVIRLWAWENLEPREIAEVLDVTPNAISVRLKRVRSRLEIDLSRQNAAASGHDSIESHRELES